MIITTPLSAFELPPEGDYPAYIDQVIDLGTQFSMHNGHESHDRKLLVSYLLVDDICQANGKPFSVKKFYTASMNIRATLRKHVDGARGQKLTAAEASTFDTAWLLGRPCMATIKHADSGGEIRATVDRLAPVPEGFAMPELKEKLVSFYLSDPDPAVFQKLSDGVKKMIEKSPEWQQHPMSKDWQQQLVKNIVAKAAQQQQ